MRHQCCHGLEDRRQHDPPLWILWATVLAVKQFPEPRMLCDCPQRHLPRTANHVDDATQALRGNVEPEPSIYFGGIVGAGDEVEEEARGDTVLLGARGAEVRQDDVAPQVACLTKEGDAKRYLATKLVWGRVERVVDKVRDESGKAPIVSAVPEKVGERHRGVTETMHEEGLRDALREMKHPVGACQGLNLVAGGCCGGSGVEKVGKEVKERVDGHRAKVLPKKKRSGSRSGVLGP